AARLASAVPFRHDLRPDAVASAARSLVVTLVEVLPARRPVSRRRQDAVSVAEHLWSRVTAQPPAAAQLKLLDAALVLLADHELAGSTLAVPIAASYRAVPYGALRAGVLGLGGASLGPAH